MHPAVLLDHGEPETGDPGYEYEYVNICVWVGNSAGGERRYKQVEIELSRYVYFIPFQASSSNFPRSRDIS